MALRSRAAYNKFRNTGGSINAQASYALTLARKQMAAEDDYYDNAYANGQISADRYLSVLSGRQTRATNTPLQKQNLVQKIESVTQDYNDAQVQTAYKTGGEFQGKPVDDQFMIDWEKAKLDKMTPDNAAYQKQFATVDSYKNKKITNDRQQYRANEELKISQMRENSSTELMAKANMYGQLEAQARADGDTLSADKYLTSKNNLQQSADRAATSERIQAVQVANSNPVAPQSSFTTPGERSAAEYGLAGGNVPESDPQSVIQEEVAMAKEQGFTDPSQIQAYLNNKYPGLDVTEGQISLAMTQKLPAPTITPQIISIAGIDLDKKVYDRIKISREVTSFLDANAKTLKEITTLDKTISSQKALVDVLARELGNAKADNRPELQKQYNDAVEKYNTYIQRKDDLFTKAEQQQTDFPEIISKKAASIMKEQDKEFENGLQTSIDEAKEQLRTGKISKEEYISNMHGIAGTSFEGAYKQQLVNQLKKKGVKVDMNVPFEKIVTAAIQKGIKTDGDITRELYGLYGLADQTYALRADLYSRAGDPNLAIDTRNKAIEYQKQKEVLSNYVVPNLKNIRIVQNSGSSSSQNLANLKGSYKKGDFIMVDPTADATKRGISPEEAIAEFDNSHINLAGKSYEVAPNIQKSSYKNDFAKMSDAEKKNEYIYKQIDPTTGKEKAVEVKKVDYGDGRQVYVQKEMKMGGKTYKLDDMIKHGYYVQQGDTLVRNYDNGTQKGNPFLDSALGFVKDVAKGLPLVGAPLSLLDTVNKVKNAKQQQGQPQAKGFLEMAKDAIIKPAVAQEATLPEATDSAMPKDSRAAIEQMIIKTAKQYGIPPAVMLGQWAAEGRDTGMGARRNNPFNIGAFDSDPSGMNSYSTLQKGIEAYAKMITGKANTGFYGNGEAGRKAFENAFLVGKNDPVAYVKAIEQAGYAGDPKTYKDRAKNGYNSYSSFVMDTPEYKRMATATPKPTATPTLAPPPTAGVAEAYKPKSFWEQAWEGISNFIAPPVSGQEVGSSNQSKPQQQSQSQSKSTPTVSTQGFSSGLTKTPTYTPSSGGGGGGGGGGSWGSTPAPKPTPAPAPKQNIVQKVVNTVKNWWSSIWK